MPRFLLLLTLFSVSGCSSQPNADTAADTDPSADTDTDTDTDTDAAPFIDYTNAHDARMVAITAGSFVMGPIDIDPAHTVTLTHDFWMGQTEVTQGQYLAGVGANPSFHTNGGSPAPVEQVSWEDAAMYTNTLSAAEGLELCYTSDGSDLSSSLGGDPYACAGYRLPTEAEWEYAARGGESYTYSGSDTVGDVAWTNDNSDFRTHPAAGKAANAFGLYDMSGNVWEWTNDWYQIYPSQSTVDPAGATSGSLRNVRGGGWGNDPGAARVVYRNFGAPSFRESGFGFRVARTDTDTATYTDTDTDTDPAPLSDYTTAYGATMVAITSDWFEMGDAPYVHTVTLTHNFWMGQTEVTQEEYLAGVGTSPSSFSSCGSTCPVEQVSWEDAAVYANALSAAEGLGRCYTTTGSDLAESLGGDPYACDGYRLPTEAEWEYAARGGDSYAYSGSDTAGDVAWTSENSDDTTHPKAGKAPNAWGLYDMSGNVWEWTNDWSAAYPSGAPYDPAGPTSGSARVLRGGGWDYPAEVAAVYFRGQYDPTARLDFVGFRLSRSVP